MSVGKLAVVAVGGNALIVDKWSSPTELVHRYS